MNVNFDQSGDVKLETNYKLNKMHIRGPHNFIIGDKDIVLTVDTLQNDWGDNIITGSGTLTIIAKNILGLGYSPFNSGENSGNLRIIYYPSNNDDLKIWNNAQVGAQIIAPKSKVYLGGGAHVFGTIISKNFEIQDRGHLTYKKYNFGEGGNTDNNGEELDISDLISTKPATEN